jgi:hypothetical protein
MPVQELTARERRPYADSDMPLAIPPATVTSPLSSKPRRRIGVRRALKRDLPWVAGLAVLSLSCVQVLQGRLGYDSHAYWLALRGSPYERGPAEPDAYLYSPAFLHVLTPLQALDWPLFALVWSGAAAAGVCWLLAPVGWRRAIPLFLVCSYEITSGNVFWLFAIVAVIGLRHPSVWVVPALTKITPALGPVWFLVRGEWRQLLVSCSAIVVVGAGSWALDPALWHDWLTFLGTHVEGSASAVGSPLSPPPLLRVPAALALVIWGARTDRIWALPAGMALASPVFGLTGVIVVLMAIPRLNRGFPRAGAGAVPDQPARHAGQ